MMKNIFSRKKTEASQNSKKPEGKKRLYQKRWFRYLSVFVLLVLIFGGFWTYRAGSTLNKISTKGGFWASLWKSIPGVSSDKLQGEKDGQINVLLLGMRGADDPAGGLLTDTIMVAMIRPQENRVALLSIPRDLWVTYPDDSNMQGKINSVNAYYGAQGNEERGLEEMKKIVGQVTGLPINYAVSVNFQGFESLVDKVGGVDVYLDKSFSEPTQFQGEAAANFKLPAGKNHLNGQKVMFFVRARYASSDFERAKRQQQVLLALKDKLLSLGTLTDFGKVNSMLNVAGDNVKTDMDVTEMRKFFDLAGKINGARIKQKVIDDSDEEGALYGSNQKTKDGDAYVLLPTNGNFDKIHQIVEGIFKQ